LRELLCFAIVPIQHNFRRALLSFGVTGYVHSGDRG
jgi:hypothetical protein